MWVIGIANLILVGCVLVQTIWIAKLSHLNAQLVASIKSLFIQAIWPPPGEGE